MIISIALTDGKTLNLKIKKSKRAKKPSIIADIQGLQAIIPSNYEVNDLMKLVHQKSTGSLNLPDTMRGYDRDMPKNI
jgi:predicted metal-dependent hydrolase